MTVAATLQSDEFDAPAAAAVAEARKAVIGITLWRLRPSKATDAAERLIVHEAAAKTEWVPERVASTERLLRGDRVRMSIEAARSGYLYVVDQEAYADGSRGEPYLIFPTTRTRAGDNSVTRGRVIEIPAQDDDPPYFTLMQSKPGPVGEVVTVVVSPTPLPGVQVTENASKLALKTLAAWHSAWGTQSGRIEMQAGSGQAWTRAEREAGADPTRSLQKSEPTPQTIYYQPGWKSTDPALITVELRYGRRPSTK